MTLTKIDEDHPIYQRALKREGHFWKGQKGDPINPTELPETLLVYKRQCQTGDSTTDIYDYLAKLGPFKRALSIGCGSAVVERELLRRSIVSEFAFIDISAESLGALQHSLSKDMRKRTSISRQDLNFIDLGENQYDLVFCANVLHHIINLEHVLLELNKSLAQDGILVIDDFIGENRFQFSDARIARINALGRKAHDKTGAAFTPLARTNPKVLINTCPFEAVRSEDILPLLKRIYDRGVVRQSTYGAVSTWMNVVIRFDQDKRRLKEAAVMFVADDKRSRLPPLSLFGVYRKNPWPRKINVKKWNERDIKDILPVSTINEGPIFRMSGWLRKVIGEGALYNALKRVYFKVR